MLSLFHKRSFSLLLLLVFVAPIQAQQQTENALGATIDLVGGGTNNPYATPGSSSKKPLSLFYGIYPAFNVNARGSHSEFKLSYAGGLNRNQDQANPNSDSHEASLKLSQR